MVEKTITQRKRQRDLAANRAARYRLAHAQRADVRAIDRSVCEAVAAYAQTLPPEASKAFLAAMVEMAGSGLEYRGYAAVGSRKRTAKRLASWMAQRPTSGAVRPALQRDAVTL